MALKDWKKIINEKDIVTYQHKNYNSNRKVVQAYRTDLFGEGKWRVTYNSKGKFVDDKIAKNKSQALKYARGYMRKH